MLNIGDYMNKIKNKIAIVTETIKKTLLEKLKVFDVEERAIAYIAEWFQSLVTW